MRTVGVILVVLLVVLAGTTVHAANIARDAIGGDWSTAVDWEMDTVPGADDTAIHNENFGTLRYDADVDPGNQTIDAFIGTGGGATLNPSRLQFEDGTILHVTTALTLGITANLKYLVLFPSTGSATLDVGETITGGQWNVRANSLVTAGAINPAHAVWIIAGEVRTVDNMEDPNDDASSISVNANGTLRIGTDGSGDMLISSLEVNRIGANLGTLEVADNISAYSKFLVDGGSVTADTAGVDPNNVGLGEFTIQNDGTVTVTSELRLPATGSGPRVIVYGDVGSSVNTLDVHDLNLASESSVIHPPDSATAPSLRLEVSGDLSVATTATTLEGQWDATGVDLVLDGNSAQAIEGISVDFAGAATGVWFEHQLGGSCSDYIYIRPWKSLRVASGATVNVVDNNVNGFRGSGDSKDAIYVDGDVTIESGATLNLGSFVLYYTGDLDDDNGNGTINGTTRHKVKRCYGDFDDDGDVDLSDFAILAQAFGGSGQTPVYIVGDADCDQHVDLSDFAIFSQNFTGSGGACPGGESSGGGAGESAEEIADWCLSHLSEEACTSFAETLAAVAEQMGETEEAAFYLDIAELLTAE